MFRNAQIICFFLLCSFGCINSAFADIAQQSDVQKFIRMMHVKHGFNQHQLTQLFTKVNKKDKIIKAINTPYEAKPWYIYRKHFINQKRIKNGVKFWHQHRKILALEEKQYGVPAEIVVAIIGVESHYGKHAGRFRVIDALSTLAFYYPRREKFFTKELESYLLLCREKELNPLAQYGSYAGAMGWPQFMPSSYRAYAVDFNHNGHTDIWNSADDVIGSIGHYLQQNKWQRSQPIAIRVKYLPNQWQRINFNDAKRPQKNVKYWTKIGFTVPNHISKSTKANLLRLPMQFRKQYWMAFNNFYSIMSYNPRINYAMAVYQLSHEIKRSYRKNAPDRR